MLVVSDSTPLNILIRTDLIDVLPELYGSVMIPPAVARELSHENTPQQVRDWIASRPGWVGIRTPSSVDETVARDRGECEAICLAVELNADLLLVHDKEARQAAARAGLAITGTLGVIELAAHRNLIDLRQALERIRQTDFFLSDDLIQRAIERDAQRRQSD